MRGVGSLMYLLICAFIFSITFGLPMSGRLDRIANLTEYLTANKNELEKIYKVYVIISEIKNQIKRKLDSLDSIDSFVETENGYEVSPAEGFVAVDRMGDAVKIVDRLDFSAKNFSKPKADKFN